VGFVLCPRRGLCGGVGCGCGGLRVGVGGNMFVMICVWIFFMMCDVWDGMCVVLMRLNVCDAV